MSDIADRVTEALGAGVRAIQSLSGGSIADVCRVELDDGRVVAVKTADAHLDVEANMLRDLADTGLPVPDVLHADAGLLIMVFIPGNNAIDTNVEIHAADLIVGLHNRSADTFGYGYDTLIGGLHQPNPRLEDWLAFFRDHRLLAMADQAYEVGRLPGNVRHRLDVFAERLDRWIPKTGTPSLLHGDLWGGNVLCNEGRVAAFIDPAVYYGDAEIELAFSTLFNTFGDRFFARYAEHRELDPDFFTVRKDLYNLYPLLVHVRLFGGSYVTAVTRTLERFGC